MIGRTISHYEILEKLGEGGMGVVYKAHDTKLNRTVALKFLPQRTLQSEEERKRITREAQAAASLSHANIATVYEIDEVDEHTFIAMEYIDGIDLYEKIRSGPLPINEAIDIAIEIAKGLQAAHEKGVVHRDIKGSNVMVTEKGEVKLMDFGLAKMRNVSLLTKKGSTLGTVPYMSPEQAQGEEVDHRTDIWSLGVLIYEMITGKRPFRSEYETALVYLIINEDPEPLRKHIPDISPGLTGIIDRALKKDPESRYSSMLDMLDDLKQFRKSLDPEEPVSFNFHSVLQSIKRPKVAVPVVSILLVLIIAAAWFFNRQANISWAKNQAPAQIEDYIEERNFVDAFTVAQEALDYVPDDQTLVSLLHNVSYQVNIISDPPGARVYYKPYMEPGEPWQEIGITPLEDVLLPQQHLRWRAELEGYEPQEGGFTPGAWGLFIELHPSEQSRDGMVWVPQGAIGIGGGSVGLDGFWIDRYEVTNEEFARFVAAGGYENEEYWQEALVDDDLTWEEAQQGFRDRTGRPGPADWELGRPPEGTEDLPVSGISWYEAVAYCNFMEKNLPTVYHWRRATGHQNEIWKDIVTMSNFSKEGAAPRGQYAGISRYGAYDMAGNVKEWIWNATGEQRYIFGGAWSEPEYMYMLDYARPPAERDNTLGVRCAVFDTPVPDELLEPVETTYFDFSEYEPVDDDMFEIIKRMYDYEPAPLDTQFVQVEETRHWRRETVSINAAYGGARLPVHLYIPHNVSPPYQTVIIFAGAGKLLPSSSDHPLELNYFDFIARSGRVMVYPVYRHSHERNEPDLHNWIANLRELVIHWSQDLGRTLDYLETRDDIDHETIAYWGFSLGANIGPIFGAVHERLGSQMLFAGGLPDLLLDFPPETIPLNFAPRLRDPVLMINGKEDFLVGPPEKSMKPLFDQFATPDEHKRFVLLEGGHVPDDFNAVMRETLDWLDRYQGPVKRE